MKYVIYERIIIGGGAAGLFCAASASVSGGLILEASPSAGRKLLLSGSGQCNLTHGGSIRDFISHYGENGTKIRSALYQANNLLLIETMESLGVSLMEREDGKLFPRSLKASHVLRALLDAAAGNGYKLIPDFRVGSIRPQEDGTYTVSPVGKHATGEHAVEEYRTKKLVIAAGGCSFPDTGSDGNIFPILESLGIQIIPPAPALTPVFVQDYPYGELSGISFPDAEVTLGKHRLRGGLLLTHRGFSGPAVLNLSRYAKPGDPFKINYLPDLLAPDGCMRHGSPCSEKATSRSSPASRRQISGNKKQAVHYFSDQFRGCGLPVRLIETMLPRAGIDPHSPAASLSGKKLTEFYRLLACDTFSISGLGGFRTAMVTRGGVALSEINLKTFECKKLPGLYVIGESLDIDGDTGGYNLQFAFSSGRLAAMQ